VEHYREGGLFEIGTRTHKLKDRSVLATSRVDLHEYLALIGFRSIRTVNLTVTYGATEAPEVLRGSYDNIPVFVFTDGVVRQVEEIPHYPDGAINPGSYMIDNASYVGWASETMKGRNKTYRYFLQTREELGKIRKKLNGLDTGKIRPTYRKGD
jgi:hypothetical protein